MPLITSRRELTEVCTEAFERWDNLESILLFGSRVRGTARPDSDWDIALIVNDPAITCVKQNKRQPAPFDRYENLDVVTLTPVLLHADLASYGTITQQIAQDGQRIIGDWDMDQDAIRDNAVINPRDWYLGLEASRGHIQDAVNSVQQYKQETDYDAATMRCQSFIVHSQDAAEFLVKAMLKRRKIPPKHTHDLTRLVQTMRSSVPDDIDASLWSALSNRIELLDGFTFLDHQAEYRSASIEVAAVERAAQRLARTLGLFIDEVDSALDPSAVAEVMGLSATCLGDAAHQTQLKTLAQTFPQKIRAFVASAQTVFALPNAPKKAFYPPDPAAESYLTHIGAFEQAIYGAVTDWAATRHATV
ncbi:MAG: nucleotidyltransferase domain-containing protein [Aestuariivita sp.]|nr:nucleotidyltransferase domain-containing protein [Aestuariivita sp.]MCY4201660.1 nucleotidyltransferase domain-containing protein [Aestuariivita sp.]